VRLPLTVLWLLPGRVCTESELFWSGFRQPVVCELQVSIVKNTGWLDPLQITQVKWMGFGAAG